MAINPNTSHQNRHHIYIATSGGGKSQAMGQNKEIPKNGRVIIWDTHNEFKADGYVTMPAFLRALSKVHKNKAFRISYTGRSSIKNFNIWCDAVWEVLDGNKNTYFMVDEVAEVVESIGKERGALGQLMRGSRKFGGRGHLTATRAAEIPKTLLTSCQYKYVGVLDSISDSKTMADVFFIKSDDFLRLKPMQFYIKEPNQPARRADIKYKNLQK
ncbi:MAG: hypothetical protein QM500_04115 [Methylococcales bacterium]